MSLDPGRPNILWVSFEGTNPFYGCYGDPVARTPVVDRLLRRARDTRWRSRRPESVRRRARR